MYSAVSPPNTLHGRGFICGRMTQAGKSVIDQQEGNKVGASGDDLGAPSMPSVTGPQPPPAACASGEAAPMCQGLLAANRLHRVYTGALLAAAASPYK